MNMKTIWYACLVSVLLVANVCVAQDSYQDWQYTVEVDEFDDSETHFISVGGSELLRLSGGEGPVPGVLCTDSLAYLFLKLQKFFAGDENDEIIVQLRVDEGEPYRDYWTLSTTGQVQTALPIRNLPIRMRRYSNQPERLASSIAGLSNPLEDMPQIINEIIQGIELRIAVTDPHDNERLASRVSLAGFSEAFSRLPCSDDYFPLYRAAEESGQTRRETRECLLDLERPITDCLPEDNL